MNPLMFLGPLMGIFGSLFGGNAGSQQINQATTDFNQLGNEGMAAWGPSFQMYQWLMPLLQQTAQGFGPLYEAARSPAIAQAQQGIRTLENSNLGSVANPNALFQDMMTNSEQTASLGANNVLENSVGELGQMATAGMNFSGQSLGTAGQGLGQIGEQEQAQTTSMIDNLFQGLGSYFGMKSLGSSLGGALGGMMGGGYNPAVNGPGGINAGAPPESWGNTEINPAAMASGTMPAGSASGFSAPISAPNPGMSPGWQEMYYQPGQFGLPQ